MYKKAVSMIKRGAVQVRDNFMPRAAVVTGIATMSVAARADGGVDATVVVAAIVAAGVSAALIGNAKLVMQVGIAGFKWIRSAF